MKTGPDAGEINSWAKFYLAILNPAKFSDPKLFPSRLARGTGGFAGYATERSPIRHYCFPTYNKKIARARLLSGK